ncbi:MAG: MATE family efflux transporter [Eubacterium sp.]
MNFGILMVQGLVNSFGTTIMAAFTAGVKIDTFAYLPVQDFGNAFSTFVAQNYGAEKHDRIRKGTREAFAISIIFSIIISALVCIFAAPLMKIFVSSKDVEVIAAGVKYLRIEGAFTVIGCLFCCMDIPR